MTALTINGDLGWTRTEIDEVTGASAGMCDRQGTQYEIANWVLFFIPVALSAIMAWKTLDIDYSYSESKWVLALILVHLNVSRAYWYVVSLSLFWRALTTSPSF
jgi:hypothetical protein